MNSGWHSKKKEEEGTVVPLSRAVFDGARLRLWWREMKCSLLSMTLDMSYDPWYTHLISWVCLTRMLKVSGSGQRWRQHLPLQFHTLDLWQYTPKGTCCYESKGRIRSNSWADWLSAVICVKHVVFNASVAFEATEAAGWGTTETSPYAIKCHGAQECKVDSVFFPFTSTILMISCDVLLLFSGTGSPVLLCKGCNTSIALL